MYITLKNKKTHTTTNHVTRLRVHKHAITLQAHDWARDRWFTICKVSPFSTLSDVCYFRGLDIADATDYMRVQAGSRRDPDVVRLDVHTRVGTVIDM